MAVRRTKAQRAQDQEVERALEQRQPFLFAPGLLGGSPLTGRHAR